MKYYCLGFFLFVFLIFSCGGNSSDNEIVEDDPISNAENCSGGTLSNNSVNTSFFSQNVLNEFAQFGYTNVEGSIEIFNGVIDLSPLNCLESVGLLNIRSRDLLNLRGLENLKHVGELYIANVDNIKNLDGLNGLTSVGRIIVAENDELIDFQGLDSLKSLSALLVNDNPNLESLDGLENLIETKEIGNEIFGAKAEIRIVYNPKLNSISGIQNITGYMVELTVKNNPLLTNWGYFSGVTSMQSILISESDTFDKFNFFPELEDIVALSIIDCKNFGSIDLPAIKRMGFMVLGDNPSFHSLEGLSTLTEFYAESPNDNTVSNLALSDLPLLETLKGLENVHTNKGKVNITSFGNSRLNNVCALSSLVSNYVAQGTDFPYNNHISLRTICSTGYDLLLDFENLCNCN